MYKNWPSSNTCNSLILLHKLRELKDIQFSCEETSLAGRLKVVWYMISLAGRLKVVWYMISLAGRLKVVWYMISLAGRLKVVWYIYYH